MILTFSHSRMAFNNPSSKFERAVRQYLIQQGKATSADTFISNDTSTRSVLPNRTVQVAAFNPKVFFRPEGTVHCQIQHHFPALQQPIPTQPGQAQPPAPGNPDLQRVNFDKYFGDTLDSMLWGDGQSFESLADAITAAGRGLAIDGSNGADPVQVQNAKNNADMANFRCDWVAQAEPAITRGNSEGADGKTFWVEIFNFKAFVSTASKAQD